MSCILISQVQTTKYLVCLSVDWYTKVWCWARNMLELIYKNFFMRETSEDSALLFCFSFHETLLVCGYWCLNYFFVTKILICFFFFSQPKGAPNFAKCLSTGGWNGTWTHGWQNHPKLGPLAPEWPQPAKVQLQLQGWLRQSWEPSSRHVSPSLNPSHSSCL